MTARLQIIPLKLAEANAFVQSYHRHNKPVQGARFAIGAKWDDLLAGVAIVGRPVSYKNEDGTTAEVLRLCTDAVPRIVTDRSGKEHTVSICSALYAASWRAWRAMGGTRLITFTLATESGSSLRGAGWKVVGQVEPIKGKGWTNRPGREWQAVHGQLKLKWEAA